MRIGRRLREIERIALEIHDRRILLLEGAFLALLALDDFQPMHAAGLEHEEGAALVLHDRALLGQEGRALLRIAPVVDEHAEQHAVGMPFADVKTQPALEAVEAAGLHDVADQVGAHLVGPVVERLHAERTEPGADHAP